jgi:hypothetical protein
MELLVGEYDDFVLVVQQLQEVIVRVGVFVVIARGLPHFTCFTSY